MRMGHACRSQTGSAFAVWASVARVFAPACAEDATDTTSAGGLAQVPVPPRTAWLIAGPHRNAPLGKPGRALSCEAQRPHSSAPPDPFWRHLARANRKTASVDKEDRSARRQILPLRKSPLGRAGEGLVHWTQRHGSVPAHPQL